MNGPIILPARLRDYYLNQNLIIHSAKITESKIHVKIGTTEDDWVYLNGEWTRTEDIPITLLSFNYWRARTDGTPLVLCLSRYEHPGTGNHLLTGLNLKYLNSDQIDDLAFHLSKIFLITDHQLRCQQAWSILPDIMSVAYRQYDESQISHEEEIKTTIGEFCRHKLNVINS
jgi:hypothetical protein